MIYISQGLYLQDVSQLIPSLEFPRVGYKTIIDEITVTSTATGYDKELMKTNTTYERWKPLTTPADVIMPVAPTEIEYVAIGAHRLTGWSVKLELNGEEVAEVLPTSNNAIMFLFERTLVTEVRIKIAGSGTQDPEIGVIKAGDVLAFPRGIYGGHSPITMARETDKTLLTSEQGEYIGTSVVRRSLTSMYHVEHLEALWVREKLDDFIKYARTQPFFLAWKPKTYSREVVYGWSVDDIVPVNMGVKDYMSVDISVRGYDEV